MQGPTVAPAPALPDPRNLENLGHEQYVAMLESCIPTLKADHAAAVYLLAELRREGDVQVKKRHFMKAAGRIQGGLPPFVEIALNLVKVAGKS